MTQCTSAPPRPAAQARETPISITVDVTHSMRVPWSCSQTMKVPFDLNIVSHMHRLNKLAQLAPPGSNIIPHASVTFLKELCGLYRKDRDNFFEIIDWYRSCTWGRLMKRWDLLVIEETEVSRSSVTYSRALEPPGIFHRALNAISDEGLIRKLDQQVRTENMPMQWP